MRKQVSKEFSIHNLPIYSVSEISNAIKNTIESFYGVKVKKVRTINVRSNSKIRYTKSGIQYGKTNSYKKAIVQLQDGETIDLYANSQ